MIALKAKENAVDQGGWQSLTDVAPKSRGAVSALFYVVFCSRSHVTLPRIRALYGLSLHWNQTVLPT